jgi:hypothetical protein
MAAPRSADVSLDSSKAFALGYEPLSLREELEALRAKFNFYWVLSSNQVNQSGEVSPRSKGVLRVSISL